MKKQAEKQPLIAITMGCPVGIGPEIIIKFFQQHESPGHFQPVVLGDAGVLRHNAAVLGLRAEIVPWHPGQEIRAGTIPVLELSALPLAPLRWGKPDHVTAVAMATYIERAVELAAAGVLAAIVTCPIAKSALNMAGYNYPGHTEMLADLTATDRYAMMMAGERLKVVLVTIHEPLRRVAELLTTARIIQTIELTLCALRHDFGISEPRVAVAGLNPHGGEHGLFGNEESDIIAPAIAASTSTAAAGLVSGPYPPDTLFYRQARGEFDAVIAMYHDQGLIPFKLLHFSDGVNVTIGLPIVRTSVDHGTAYDIAGQGKADSASLRAAVHLAALMATNRAQRAMRHA